MPDTPRPNDHTGGPPPTNHDPLLTLKECAEYTGLSHWTLRQHIAAGRLEALRLSPRMLRVRRSALERFLAQASTAAGWVEQ